MLSSIGDLIMQLIAGLMYRVPQNQSKINGDWIVVRPYFPNQLISGKVSNS